MLTAMEVTLNQFFSFFFKRTVPFIHLFFNWHCRTRSGNCAWPHYHVMDVFCVPRNAKFNGLSDTAKTNRDNKTHKSKIMIFRKTRLM